MFDEEEPTYLPYDDVPEAEQLPEYTMDQDGDLDPPTTNGVRGGDLASRLAPPTKVYRLADSIAVQGTLGKLKGISQDAIEPEDNSMDVELGYRPNALLLQGEPISHLPTDHVFAYVATFAPVPVGLEWVDDTTCVVLFSSAAIARAARRFLMQDAPAEGDPMPDALALLPARPVPAEAWPEKAALRLPDEDADVDADAKVHAIRAALTGPVYVRHARLVDVKARDAKTKSRFYETYGAQAGKAGYGRESRKRRREEEGDGDEMGGEKRRALDDELESYLADEPGERARRRREDLDSQLDSYLAGDEPVPNGNGNGRDDRDRTTRKVRTLDAQLDAYNEADDADVLPSKMRSDWAPDVREREFSPERDDRRRRGERRYADAPVAALVARPMRDAERWERNGNGTGNGAEGGVEGDGEEDVEGERRRRRPRGGRGRRGEERNGVAPSGGGGGRAGEPGGRRSGARPRKDLDELDAELDAYLNNN